MSEEERQRLAELERQREEERCRRLACYVFTPNGTAYDLKPLENPGRNSTDDYLKPVDARSTLEYNFCRHLSGNYYFARWISYDFPTKILTSDVCEPDQVEEVVKNDEIIGVKVEHYSEFDCDFEGQEGRKLGFVYTVLCDETVDAAGGAIAQTVDVDDICRPHVVLTHKAGCHKREVTPGQNITETVIEKEVEVQILSDYIYDNPIVFGIALILIGAPVAVVGQRWFKWVLAGFGGFSTCVIVAFTAEETGWLEWSVPICLAAAVVAGLVVALILYKCHVIGAILIGVVLGAAVGVCVWAIFDFWILWSKSILASLVFTVLFAVLGGFFGAKCETKTICFGTSLIGSYTFMRGWSLLFSGYIGERTMYHTLSRWEPVVVEWQMAVYVALLYICFAASAFFQFYVEEARKLLQKFTKDQGRELNDLQAEAGVDAMDKYNN